MQKLFPAIILFFFLTSCGCGGPETPPPGGDTGTDNVVQQPPAINYSIIKVYPHDTSSYTQGLFLNNNILYEGTGQPGHSKLAIIDLATGKPKQEVKINPAEFGEGIAMLNGKIFQLTWQNNVVHVYDAATLKKINDFSWPYEGWGLTTDGKNLIVSTGSSNLYYVSPDSFKIVKQVAVTDNYGPVAMINELEFINGFVYANQYETNYILKIDPATGNVTGRLDCTDILTRSGMSYDPAMYELQTGNVLNGIAYNPSANSLYITGKLWPALFEIKLTQ